MDPGFQATVHRIGAVAAAQRRHGSAPAAASAAQAAAPGPAGEVRAAAAAQQVRRIDAQEPKPFDARAFATLLRARLEQKKPRNPVEAREFPTSGALTTLGGELTTDAKAGAASAGSQIKGESAAAPDQSGISPKPVAPLPGLSAGPAPADIGTGQAVPKPRAEATVTGPIVAGQESLAATMRSAKVTDEQLAASNEPTFTAALADKQASADHAAGVPQRYRAGEAATLTSAQGQAVAAGQQKTAAMHEVRAGLLGQVGDQQKTTMGADQAARAGIAQQFEDIYAKTAKDVEARLEALDKEVADAFSAAITDARKAFESYVERKLDERYSDPLVWIDDKLLTWGLPEGVQAIYDAGRTEFLAAVDAAIDHVAELVANGLNEAKACAAAGRKEVAEAVEKLDPALREVGLEAAAQIGAKFDGLDASISAKQEQLVDTLVANYQDAVHQLDERITELQKENEGFLSKAVSAVTGTVKTILELKDLLMTVLAKAASTLDVIIADPIRFLGNLVAAVGQGVQGFLDNIATHLKQGFFQWLFGQFASAGITLPQTWDLKGVFHLVMQVLGLTWANIRKIAVEVVGEPIVAVLETAAEPIVLLIREGPGALWNWVKEQLANLKAMVVDQLEDWLITNVVKAGIAWLIGLLNPASAFIKACKAIYDILQFVVTRGKQILEFVAAIVDTVTEIAAGSLGNAAKKVEAALAKALPVTIGFLASLLGLGNISEKIKAIITKIQAPVHAAVKWLITKAVALVKVLGKTLGSGRKREEQTPAEREVARDAALGEAQEALQDDKNDIADATKALTRIRDKHQVRVLSVVIDSENAEGAVAHVVAENSAAKTGPKVTKSSAGKAKATLNLQSASQRKPSGLDPANPPPGVAVLDQTARNELAARWQNRAASEADPKKKAWMEENARRAWSGDLPQDGRASEQEVVWLHESVGAATQVRRSVPRGVDPQGSTTTIPDLELSSWSIETKRYIINRPKGRAELIQELRRQYAIRLGSLPAHAQLQAIIVDVRGQYLKPDAMQALRREIYEQVVVACYAQAKAAGKWWILTNATPPGPDSVTILAGDVG
ncbi:hypothetical protein ACI78V_09225 [Geodermatophilus sp. SYSU D00742]